MRVWDNQRSRHTTWQKSLKLLKTLKIVISVDACLHPAVRKALAELPQKADIFLRAKKMQVEVRVPSCAERATKLDQFGNLQCDGQCARIVQQVYESMLN